MLVARTERFTEDHLTDETGSHTFRRREWPDGSVWWAYKETVPYEGVHWIPEDHWEVDPNVPIDDAGEIDRI